MNSSTLGDGHIVQVAYVTDNLVRSIKAFGRTFGISAWAMVQRVPFKEVRLRGERCNAAVAAAFAIQNDMMYEFIQPLDELPSVYRHPDTNILLTGYHHVAVIVPDLQSAIRRYELYGYRSAMECRMAGGIQAAYIEPEEEPTGFIELLESGPGMDAFLAAVKQLDAGGEEFSVAVW